VEPSRPTTSDPHSRIRAPASLRSQTADKPKRRRTGGLPHARRGSLCFRRSTGLAKARAFPPIPSAGGCPTTRHGCLAGFGKQIIGLVVARSGPPRTTQHDSVLRTVRANLAHEPSGPTDGARSGASGGCVSAPKDGDPVPTVWSSRSRRLSQWCRAGPVNQTGLSLFFYPWFACRMSLLLRSVGAELANPEDAAMRGISASIHTLGGVDRPGSVHADDHRRRAACPISGRFSARKSSPKSLVCTRMVLGGCRSSHFLSSAGQPFPQCTKAHL